MFNNIFSHVLRRKWSPPKGTNIKINDKKTISIECKTRKNKRKDYYYGTD